MSCCILLRHLTKFNICLNIWFKSHIHTILQTQQRLTARKTIYTELGKRLLPQQTSPKMSGIVKNVQNQDFMFTGKSVKLY